MSRLPPTRTAAHFACRPPWRPGAHRPANLDAARRGRASPGPGRYRAQRASPAPAPATARHHRGFGRCHRRARRGDRACQQLAGRHGSNSPSYRGEPHRARTHSPASRGAPDVHPCGSEAAGAPPSYGTTAPHSDQHPEAGTNAPADCDTGPYAAANKGATGNRDAPPHGGAFAHSLTHADPGANFSAASANGQPIANAHPRGNQDTTAKSDPTHLQDLSAINAGSAPRARKGLAKRSRRP